MSATSATSPSDRYASRGLRWRAFWLRWLTLAALVFAIPITQQVMTEVASVLMHDDAGCDDDCKAGDCCPGPCEVCSCCPHSGALPVMALTLENPCASGEVVTFAIVDVHSSGYVSPPFRPPTG